jgi:hypothetical protein
MILKGGIGADKCWDLSWWESRECKQRFERTRMGKRKVAFQTQAFRSSNRQGYRVGGGKKAQVFHSPNRQGQEGEKKEERQTHPEHPRSLQLPPQQAFE